MYKRSARVRLLDVFASRSAGCPPIARTDDCKNTVSRTPYIICYCHCKKRASRLFVYHKPRVRATPRTRGERCRVGHTRIYTRIPPATGFPETTRRGTPHNAYGENEQNPRARRHHRGTSIIIIIIRSSSVITTRSVIVFVWRGEKKAAFVTLKNVHGRTRGDESSITARTWLTAGHVFGRPCESF